MFNIVLTKETNPNGLEGVQNILSEISDPNVLRPDLRYALASFNETSIQLLRTELAQGNSHCNKAFIVARLTDQLAEVQKRLREDRSEDSSGSLAETYNSQIELSQTYLERIIDAIPDDHVFDIDRIIEDYDNNDSGKYFGYNALEVLKNDTLRNTLPRLIQGLINSETTLEVIGELEQGDSIEDIYRIADMDIPYVVRSGYLAEKFSAEYEKIRKQLADVYQSMIQAEKATNDDYTLDSFMMANLVLRDKKEKVTSINAYISGICIKLQDLGIDPKGLPLSVLLAIFNIGNHRKNLKEEAIRRNTES
jgi:hypothetical protein